MGDLLPENIDTVEVIYGFFQFEDFIKKGVFYYPLATLSASFITEK
ncbi:hypothetical protein [Corynebacterium glutamicum]|nr:hypothetical protein [Corynebacterium glutamicum]